MLHRFMPWFNRYKFRNRVILAYLVVSLITALIICLSLYSLMSGIVLNHIGTNSLLSLKQTASAADMLIEQMNIVQSQLLVELDLQNFVYARQEDKALTYRAALVLKRLMSVYPFIHAIELYNAQANVYFNTQRPVISEQPLMAEEARRLYQDLAYDNFRLLPRQITLTKETTPQTYQVLSFIFRPETFIRTQAMVILDLDVAYIEKNIIGYSATDPLAQTMLINSRNIVLAHNDHSRFLQDLSDQDYVGRFFGASPSDKNREGYSTENIDGRLCLVAYTRSSIYDWYFISIRPYDSVVGGLRQTRDIILGTTAIAFVLALIIYLILACGIYNPFRRMLERLGGVPDSSNDIETLSRTVSRNIWYQNNHEMQCQDYFLRELFQGVRNTRLDDDMRVRLTHKFQAGSYQVLIFCFDNVDFLRHRSPDLVLLNQYCLVNMVNELFSAHCCCSGTSLDDDRVAALCCLPQACDFAKQAANLSAACEKLLQTTVSTAAGPLVEALPDIRRSFLAAEKLIGYRLFMGHGCYLTLNNIQPYLNNDALYPYDLETGLIKSIQNADIDAIKTAIKSFAEILRETACDHVHHYAAQMIFAILRCADAAGTARSLPADLVGRIQITDTVDGMIEPLEQLAVEIGKGIQDALHLHGGQKHLLVIQQIKDYVGRHYHEANLSIDTVADVVHLSPEYVRKLYKQVESVSFSHDLTRLRLETACRLLAETDLPVQRIGEQVGLTNPTYFFTLFKRAYGVTPAVYRGQGRSADHL